MSAKPPKRLRCNDPCRHDILRGGNPNVGEHFCNGTLLRTAGRRFIFSPAKLNMIYLDYNATTPTAPEALEAMMPYLTSEWGILTLKQATELKAANEIAG